MDKEVLKPLIFVRFNYSYWLQSSDIFYAAASIARKTYNYTFGNDEKVTEFLSVSERVQCDYL